MKSFEKFKEILLNDGCICSDRAITQVPIHDTIKSGDILILPPNPTFFKKEFSNGNQVEFVLCQDVSTGDLKRLYLANFITSDARGTAVKALNEYGSFTEFFRNNQNKSIKITFTTDYYNIDFV